MASRVALQTQMDRLEGTSAVGGERNDAAEHCMAGIARLANEVKDASTYIPVYDQKLYGEVRWMHLGHHISGRNG